MENIYQPIEGIIEEVITESPTIKTFVVRPQEKFEFRTGQFIELSLPGIGEAPFTPSSDPNIKDKFDVTIMNAGKITSLLHNTASNTSVGIRGPYGMGYPLDTFQGKDILIVGGGVGLAPLRSLLL
ncbi:MAG: FAD-binding oxidoreductase, partial [Candidatus Omnitrophica bacterium]|nr:FAD-binding oxidoreductase [Candidatus Omnitrophota bacterium]